MQPLSPETVWHNFYMPLNRFIRSRIPDEATAEDVLQDVYIKIHEHLHTLRHDTQLQAWVYQIARNAIYDFYRRQKQEVAIEDIPDLPETMDENDDTTARLTRSIREMLKVLPKDYQEALILTEYEGLTQKELADRTGLSFSGAKSRVQRARKMLRELLLACCHFQFDRYGAVIDFQSRRHCCAQNPC